MVLSDRNVNLVDDHVDLAVRIGALAAGVGLTHVTHRDESAEIPLALGPPRSLREPDEDSDFSAIELIRIEHYVSDLLRADANVTTRAGLHPLIRDQVVA